MRPLSDREITVDLLVSLLYKCCSHQIFREPFVPAGFRTDTGSNLVSDEMENYLEEMEIVHHCNIPL